MGSKSNRSRRYTEEFKRDAVALVRSSGKTVTEVARQLGVSAEGLRNWVKQDAVDRGQGAPGELTTAEREELRRLRRLAAEQAETIEVLRKAAVFFAKEKQLLDPVPGMSSGSLQGPLRALHQAFRRVPTRRSVGVIHRRSRQRRTRPV
ncbi:transposase [Streptomyces sp. NPDC001093]|uniref:transposase n=1 Tax=Streptomyces sp. NPDC001093 TaxID=3154376 RepID=UPI003317107D